MSTNVVITVTRGQSEGLVCGLARACQRKAISYSLFFTGAGVATLDNSDVLECALQANEGIACEYSWDQHRKNVNCPVEIGSQTDHSRLIKTADRLVTL